MLVCACVWRGVVSEDRRSVLLPGVHVAFHGGETAGGALGRGWSPIGPLWTTRRPSLPPLSSSVASHSQCLVIHAHMKEMF